MFILERKKLFFLSITESFLSNLSSSLNLCSSLFSFLSILFQNKKLYKNNSLKIQTKQHFYGKSNSPVLLNITRRYLSLIISLVISILVYLSRLSVFSIIRIFVCFLITIQKSVIGFSVEEYSKLIGSLTNSSVYNKNIRPDFGGRPVMVNVTILITDISSISEIEMDFTVDFYLRQCWHDPRLKFTTGNQTNEELVLGSEFTKALWLPDTFIRNSKSMTSHFTTAFSSNSLIRIKSDGSVFYSTRLTTTAACSMDLRFFPADKQNCRLVIASYGYSTRDLNYNWALEPDSLVLEKDIMVPNFSIAAYNRSKSEQVLTTGVFARLYCEFTFERSIGYYMYQIYIPAFLIVAISWTPFWLDRDDNHARVALGVTTVLTMTTLTTNTNDSVAKVSYIKAIDIYLFMCFIMVFLSLIEYATVGFFESKKRSHHAAKRQEFLTAKVSQILQPADTINEKSISQSNSSSSSNLKRLFSKEYLYQDTSAIDKMARFMFPIIFITFNSIYITAFFIITHR